MGTGPSAKKHGARSKVKKYKKKTWLCNRAKDTDQIQDEIEKAKETGKPIQFEFDDELPGGGQFYCVETGKPQSLLGAGREDFAGSVDNLGF